MTDVWLLQRLKCYITNFHFNINFNVNSSAIRQTANLKTEVRRKQSMPFFPKNEHFLPLDTHTYVCVSGSMKCLFFGKFGVLCFLLTSVFRFSILPYYGTVSSSISFHFSENFMKKTGQLTSSPL